jgi:hypothetical protein
MSNFKILTSTEDLTNLPGGQKGPSYQARDFKDEG